MLRRAVKGGFERSNLNVSKNQLLYKSPVLRRIRRTSPFVSPLMRKSSSLSAVDITSSISLEHLTSADISSRETTPPAMNICNFTTQFHPDNPISSDESVDGAKCCDQQETIHELRPAGQVFNFGTLPRDGDPTKGIVPKIRLMFEKAKSLEPDMR